MNHPGINLKARPVQLPQKLVIILEAKHDEGITPTGKGHKSSHAIPPRDQIPSSANFGMMDCNANSAIISASPTFETGEKPHLKFELEKYPSIDTFLARIREHEYLYNYMQMYRLPLLSMGGKSVGLILSGIHDYSYPVRGFFLGRAFISLLEDCTPICEKLPILVASAICRELEIVALEHEASQQTPSR